MSLRTRLLLISLLTLILPWAGCQYAREMEVALRRGQEDASLTTARVLASVVALDPEQLYSDPELSSSFDPQRGDLFAVELSSPPLLDGFADEWPAPSRALPKGAQDETKPQLGIYGQSLYVFLHVRDAHVTFDDPMRDEASFANTDRVVILTRRSNGNEYAWCVNAFAPGPINARPCAIGMPWRALADAEPSISGIWRTTEVGYDLEVQLPLNLIGSRLAVFAVDSGAEQTATTLGRFHFSSPQLRRKLEQYAIDGLRISVVDAHGWLLGRAGSVIRSGNSADEDDDRLLPSLYRSLFGRTEEASQAYGLPYGMWGPPVDAAREGHARAGWFERANGEPSTIRAAVPIVAHDKTIGALVIEQDGDRLLLLRDAALTSLLNLTLVATLIAVVVSLLFAAWLSHRIRRLSRATVTALTPEGRIDARIPDTGARDELGDLARSFDALLLRLKEYTDYLQTLGSKLSHELRTPLTIVSSSLENLDETALHDDERVYVRRAREGTNRLHALLTAMTEATRVEQSIEQAERVDFDLALLVRNAALSYVQTFTDRQITIVAPESGYQMRGAPELIAQLLDKLIDNAVDFAPPGGHVEIELKQASRYYCLSVFNEGPALAPELEDKVFESMVSGRTTTHSRPHLGLGLYIVRLIADFHGGKVAARNIPERHGVIFEVELPRF